MAKAKATKAEPNASMKLAAIDRKLVELTIVGTSPLVQHAWDEKAKEMMRAKHGGKKTKDRAVRDPEAEGNAAAYRTAKGKYGIQVSALKSAIISAAHKDLGVEKTLVKKSVFIICTDPGGVLPMDCDEPTIQEDPVRVGPGSADLRYRPYFYRWSLTFKVEIDATLMTVETLINLINRAGFGVGIGEMRPEKGKDCGRFRVDTTKPVNARGV